MKEISKLIKNESLSQRSIGVNAGRTNPALIQFMQNNEIKSYNLNLSNSGKLEGMN